MPDTSWRRETRSIFCCAHCASDTWSNGTERSSFESWFIETTKIFHASSESPAHGFVDLSRDSPFGFNGRTIPCRDGGFLGFPTSSRCFSSIANRGRPPSYVCQAEIGVEQSRCAES